MDIVQLYMDYSVDFLTEGHKHCRPGWVNTPCPLCVSEAGHEGYHLGYNLQGNFFVCWRCGWHPATPTIAKLIHLSVDETKSVIKKYGFIIPRSIKEPVVKVRKKSHRMPSNIMPLQRQHVRYLESRGFDPDYLIKLWFLMATGPVSTLRDKDYIIDYRFRILIPFIWNGQQVSFDSRDITNKSKFKYLACPLDRELIPHKSILYGKQEMWKDTGICVEGPTDVWRFGVNSFATSGIKFTPKQVRLIAKTFKRVPVIFDGQEPQAKKQADVLVAELKVRGVDSFRIDIEGDPGGMEQKEANYLVKQSIK